MSYKAAALVFIVGIAVGVASARMLGDAAEPVAAVAEGAFDEGRSESRRLAQRQQAARQQEAKCPDPLAATLELSEAHREVAGLREKLSDRLDALQAANPRTGGRGSHELMVCREALENLEPELPPKRLSSRRPGDHSFDVDQMADLGFSRRDVEWTEKRWEEAKLDKLYLTDKLSRGGSAEPGESLVEYERQLREDVGDDNYAALLYSTNQMNAVALQDILEGSDAYQAGLRGGRVIHSYNGHRVFRP